MKRLQGVREKEGGVKGTTTNIGIHAQLALAHDACITERRSKKQQSAECNTDTLNICSCRGTHTHTFIPFISKQNPISKGNILLNMLHLLD